MVFMKILLICLVGELVAVISIFGMVVGYYIGSADLVFGVITLGAAQGLAVGSAISAAVVYAMYRKWSRMSAKFSLIRNLALTRKAKALEDRFHS